MIAPIALLQALDAQLADGATIVNITSDAAVEAYEGWGGYGASKAALEHASRVLAVERPDLRVLVVDPGDMRTEMHQDAFPGEDISDRPEPAASVPGLRRPDRRATQPSGRYDARALRAPRNRGSHDRPRHSTTRPARLRARRRARGPRTARGARTRRRDDVRLLVSVGDAEPVARPLRRPGRRSSPPATSSS